MTGKAQDRHRRSKGPSFPADDRGLGILGLVIGAATFLLADLQATASSTLIPGSEQTVLKGTFYPRVIAVLIMVSSLALVVLETIRLKRGGESEKWMLSKLPRRVVVASLGLLLVIALASLALEPLGFVITCSVLAALLGRWFGASSWLKAGGGAVVASTLVYLLFTVVFRSPLPPLPWQ